MISVTPGRPRRLRRQPHLRQSLVFLNVPAMPQPEAYISNASALFDDAGKLTNESTRGGDLHDRVLRLDRGQYAALTSSWLRESTHGHDSDRR